MVSKYKVLFTADSIDKSDDSINIGSKMLFGYQDEWTYDSFQEAWADAIANDYTPTQFLIVKLIDYKVIEDAS